MRKLLGRVKTEAGLSDSFDYNTGVTQNYNCATCSSTYHLRTSYETLVYKGQKQY